MGRGQTALEYLLMIAGGVLVAAVLMVVVNNNLNMAANSFESGDYSTRIQNYLSTTPETDDGDWVVVGNNQFSGVPGYVGIGTTNPQAKLEVNGKILMDDGTAASDSANIVATKGYVDNKLAGFGGSAANTTWNVSGNNQYSAVAGNVGIGTNNPTAKLAVNGNASITGATSINGNTNITGTTTLSGPTTIKGMTTINGTINATNHTVTGLAAPVDASDAATKEYVDASNVQGAYNACYILKSTSSGVACAAGFTRLAHFNGGDACWTLDNPLGATNSLSTYFTMGAAVINFDVGFAHVSYGSSAIVSYWGQYNIGLGDCTGYSGWAGSLTPVVLWTTNGVAQGFNSFINRATAQTMAICCK